MRPVAQKVVPLQDERLDSWKEIAAYLKRGARTVQRWEREAGLPVHRLQHEKLGSVYAWKSELDRWWSSRRGQLEADAAAEASRGASIGVLPFADMSQEKDQAYFCEGIADEIINKLCRIRSLQVSSRTSSFQFRSGGADVREIGRKLRVSSMLEGSVRKSGDHLRITVQLVDCDTGFPVWSERYDRTLNDLFAIQDEIAHNIVETLAGRLSPVEEQSLQAAHAPNLQAHDCYLRGRKYYYQYGPQDMDCAVQLFARAVELDPDYAAAYAGLADCWSYLYIYSDRTEAVREQANWASEKAVTMDPLSPEAQASHGFSLSIAGRDAEAEAAFETAIRLDPELFEARYYYARHWFVRGERDRAIVQYEAAMRARPEDFQCPLLSAQIYDDLDRRAEARDLRKRGIENAERHLELNPDDVRALYMAANGLAAQGDGGRAREYLARGLAMRPDDAMLLYNAGCVYAMLRDVDAAIECVVKAAAKGLTQKGWYQNDSNLDPIRSHPRFQQLLDELG